MTDAARRLVVAGLCAALLAACSGGGSGDRAATTSDPPRSVEPVPSAAFVEPPVGDAPFRFVDVTAAAGFDAPHSDTRPSSPFREIGGAAAVDYDGDGDVDVYLTRRGLPNRLMRNNGDGTFTDVAADAGVDADGAEGTPVFADIDGDGDLDLLVTGIGSAGVTRLYVNDGTGRFVDEADARGVLDDLVTMDGARVSNLFGAAFGDYDRDGDLDLAVAQWYDVGGVRLAPRSRLLENDGDGYFTDVTEDRGLDTLRTVAGLSVRFHDIDGDGWQDLFVVGDWRTSRVYRNVDGRRFEDVSDDWGVGLEKNGMGSVIADLDGDGSDEWFVTAINYPVPSSMTAATGDPSFRTFPTEGDMPCPDGRNAARDPVWGSGIHCDGNALYSWNGKRFVDVTDRFGVRHGFWGWGATASDFDLDGQVELAMTNGMHDEPGRAEILNADNPNDRFVATFLEDPNRLWRRDGDGVWTNVADATGFVVPGKGKALIAFDADGDGDLDVLQTNTETAPVLLRNDSPAGATWLKLTLAEPGGRRGVGARIEVTARGGMADGRRQVRHVTAGGTYVGQDPYAQTIGLGGATSASVTVVWPDGERQDLGEVEANRSVTVTRGAGVTG